MLSFEKEVIESCTNKNHLLILSEGLGIMNIIRTELLFYDYEYTLTILLNFYEDEINFLLRKVKIQNFTNILSNERNKLYKQGGIFYVTQRMFITDLLNKNIEINKISAIFIANVDKLTPMSTECFIAQVVKKTNKDCVIKSYTEQPFFLANSIILLDEVFQSLKLDTLVLFPRFHETVKNSLKPFYINEHKLTLNKEIKEIQVYLMDIIQSLTNQYNHLLRKEKRQEKEVTSDIILSRNIRFNSDTLKGKQLIIDVCNIKRLIFLLFSVDFELFYEQYNLLFSEQMSAEGTWINNLSSHLLLEKTKEYIEKHRINLIEELPNKKIKTDLNEKTKFNFNDSFSNPKLNKLINLVNEYKEKRICILGKSSEMIKLICRHLDNKCQGFSHSEFILIEEFFDNYILIDPCLSTIRKLEVLFSKGNSFFVDTLCFKESLEEERSLLDIREDKDSFVQLIEKRSRQGLFFHEEEGIDVNVIIDVREMRSSLPFSMYKKGISLEICTLSVGDYFINSVCVERKEINDLIGSLNSGRLFNQVNHLINAFSSPILLIEFPNKMSLFEYCKKSQILKFIVLLINFPQLRILYSNSDSLTIKCLMSLEKREEVNKLSNKLDPELMEILLSIEGINYYNVYKIINNFNNLKELSLCEENKLIKLIGENNGKKVFSFFRKDLTTNNHLMK